MMRRLDRRQSRRRLGRAKTILALLLAVGSVSCLSVSGTYALLLSEETNANSTIASGTLTLGNTVNAGTMCFSHGAGSTDNINNACAALVGSSPLRYPGDPAVTAQIQIKNTGSLDATGLAVFMPTCTTATSPGATGHANGGDPCAEVFTGGSPTGLQLTIQETNSSWVATKCWYPVDAAGACTSDPGYSAAAPNSFGIFAEYVTSGAAALDVGPGPAHDQSRYFVVGVSLPIDASNTLQGEQATFDLTWQLTS